MLLDIPPYRQTDSFDCGRVVMQMECAYWGLPLPLLLANLPNPVSGLSPDTLSAAFRLIGFDVVEGSWTVALLKAATQVGLAPVVLTQLEGVGHWSVCRGVERNRVYVQCPERGSVSTPISQFERDWVDHHFTGGAFNKWAILPHLED